MDLKFCHLSIIAKTKTKKQLGQICTRVSTWAFTTSVACPPELKRPEPEMSPQVKQIRFSLEDSDRKELQLQARQSQKRCWKRSTPCKLYGQYFVQSVRSLDT